MTKQELIDKIMLALDYYPVPHTQPMTDEQMAGAKDVVQNVLKEVK